MNLPTDSTRPVPNTSDDEQLRQTDALLERLLSLAPDERAVELERLYLEKPALANRLIHLLQAWEAQDDHATPTGAAIKHLTTALPLQAGTRVGAFVIDALLGHGGMGEVYAAHRFDGQFEQTVAIKRILDTPLLDRAQAAEHLTRERALLARLSHPGLATVLDGGIDDDGYPWLAMEMIDGVRLDRHLLEARPPFEARFALLLQLVDVVGYAHRQLVVHGDLKPANLMVESDGRLRVLDFGIARSLVEDHGSAPSAAVTPGWNSPEQGRGEIPGVASDQYQIGLLARAIFANGLRGEADRKGNLRALARCNDAYTHKQIDTDLDAIIEHCLADHPEQRYPDLGGLRADLIAWRGREPISLREGKPLYRLGCFLRRNPLGSALAASLLMVLCAGSLALWQQNRNLRAATYAAQTSAAQAVAETRRQDQVLGFLEETLAAADPRGSAGAVQSVDALLDVASDGIDIEFSADPSLRTEVRAMLAFIALRREDNQRAKTLLAAAEADSDRGIRPRAMAALQLLQGDIAFYAGDAEKAETLYQQALA
ncbi:MAG TPA: protein kinase, partial [Dokdonella sp.]|uniref:serine/threonine-protein kinase n=1 Tax=Dokdonella sp. TaxID=2291710 RepID=UPI002D807AD3